MVLSSLFSPEKRSPIEGIPVIPGGTLWGGHLHLLQEPDFQIALRKWTVEHADENGRCTFWMGPTTPSLSVTHPEDVQVLLKGTAHRGGFGLMSQHFIQLFGRRNVGLLNGKEWKQQRAKITKALHSSQVVASHERAFRDATLRLVDAIVAHGDNNNTGEWSCPDILVLMKGLTMDCFGEAAFHANFGSCQTLMEPAVRDGATATVTEASQIGPALDRLTKEMMRRVTTDILIPTSHFYSLPTTANRNYARDKETVLSFLHNLIRQKQTRQLQDNDNSLTDKPPMNLLTGFLDHFEANDNNANPEEEELVPIIAESIMGLLFAGYETSSVTLTYALYLLSQHPDVLANCLEEIQTTTVTNSNNETTHQQRHPYYLEAVVKETLRLYPPAISTNRTSDRDLELPARGGSPKVPVPKGTYLYVAIWTIQRDPQNYERPLEFRPERWVEAASAAATANEGWKLRTDLPGRAQNAWIPFSAGARACPGQHFALQEIVTILSVLLPRLTFVPPSDFVLKPQRDGFIQVPEGGIPMTISRRNSKE